MPKNIKDFAKSEVCEDKFCEDLNINQDYVNFYQEHKDMTSEQLQQELFKQVAIQKGNGTFDYQKLENSVQSISPFLSDEQKEYINNILKGIK